MGGVLMMGMEENLYHYKATIIGFDESIAMVEFDLGFNLKLKEKIRIDGQLELELSGQFKTYKDKKIEDVRYLGVLETPENSSGLLYHYKSTVVSVYDGDTVTVEFDLGFDLTFREKVRLYGINAPELRGKDKAQGIISRDALREQILGKAVIIKTYKDKKEKYGRYLGTLYIEDPSSGQLVDVNRLMVESGYAKEVSYSKSKRKKKTGS